MAACPSLTFSEVTQARFDCLVQKAAADGIAISGNQGMTVVNHGPVHAQISWNFDPVNQTLTLQYLNPGIFAGCNQVNGMLHDLVASCP